MLRQLVEKTMKVKGGEQRFSPEMRRAYFGGLGAKPPEFSEKIEDVRVRGEGLDAFRLFVDLTRTRRGSEDATRSLVPSTVYDSSLDAEIMAMKMKDPGNLARANRVLERSGNLQGAVVVTAVASSALATTAVLHFPA